MVLGLSFWNLKMTTKKTTNGPPRSLKLIKRKPSSISRTNEALRRLNVTPEQLAAAPQITPMLKRAEGGIEQVLAAMRFASDEIVATFLKKYDSILPGDRERVSIEAIALSAGLDITRLLGSIMMSLQAQSVNIVKIIAMTSHPKITEARVAYGMMPLGERDRTALDTAMGFLPSPRPPTFIGKAIFGSGANVMEQQRANEGGEVVEEDAMLDLSKLFRSQSPPSTFIVSLRPAPYIQTPLCSRVASASPTTGVRLQ